MNRILLLISTICVCIQMKGVTFSGSGSGTSSDPYQIVNADQLNQVRYFLNDKTVAFKLMNNIDLTNWIAEKYPEKGWKPIGKEIDATGTSVISPFRGIFDGNGKKITGLTIKRTDENYVGLFGLTDYATIKNLTIEGDIQGGNATGSFVGLSFRGTFVGLTYNGNSRGTKYIGGIVGVLSNGSITTSKVTGLVSGTSHVGGICGLSNLVSFNKCHSHCNVIGTSMYVGGICGLSNVTYINECYSYSYVNSKSKYVGGVVGFLTYNYDIPFSKSDPYSPPPASTISTLINSMSFGDICGTDYVGGVVGAFENYESDTEYTYPNVLHIYATFDEHGNPHVYEERIFEESKTGNLTNCCSVGSIKGNNFVGGLAGSLKGCYNITKSKHYFFPTEYNCNGERNSYTIYSGVDHHTYYSHYYSSDTKEYYDSSTNSWVENQHLIIYNSYIERPDPEQLGRNDSIFYYDYDVFNLCVSLTDCYFSGELTGSNNVGGVVGSMNGGSLGRNYCNANIHGIQHVGGIIGQGQGVVNKRNGENDYLGVKSNMVLGHNIMATNNVGRIFGSVEDFVTIGTNGNTSEDNHVLSDTRIIINKAVQDLQDNEQNGVNNEIEYFKQKTNYEEHGWVFNNDWSIQEDESFPYKPWQTAPPSIISDLISGVTSINGQSIDGGCVYVSVDGDNEQTTNCSGTFWQLFINALEWGNVVSLYSKTSDKEASYRTIGITDYYSNINFADTNVKTVCLENWDSNGDGELSGAEAAMVINIGAAFKKNNQIKSFEELRFFTGLLAIDNSAFENCKVLKSITIPSCVTSIGNYAFNGCSSLISIYIPENVTSIGTSAFSGCSGLETIEVANDNPIYNSQNNCNAIIKTSIKELILGCKNTIIPNNVEYIGDYAFRGCTELTSITIPNSVTLIGTSAFSNCSSMTSINIPKSVTSIKSYAFSGCSGLETIEVANDNKTYDSQNNCNAIIKTSTKELIVGCKNTIIPNSVKSIGNNAFRGCSGLTSITIPNSVKSIGDNAFLDCVSLTSLTIPECVTSIGNSAFYNCSGLLSINIPCGVTSIDYSTFEKCSSLTSLTIPESVMSIGYSAFSYCSSLTSVTIGNSVTSIGGNAFYGCSNLTSVTVDIATPLSIENYTFSNRRNAILYVPSGCRSAYKTAAYWKEFKEIIEITDAVPGDLNDDGEVDITDLILIIDVMSGQCTDAKKMATADINQDGEVDITDIIGAIDLMILQNANGAKMNKVSARQQNSDYITSSIKGNDIIISLENQQTYSAFQMMVNMPDGLTLTDAKLNNLRAEEHQMILRQISSGQYLVTVFSLDNDVLKGNTGQLFTLYTEGLADGDIVIDNVLFGSPEALGYHLAGLTINVTPTSIAEMKNTRDGEDKTIFDLHGRRVSIPSRGVYIINGKKVNLK